MGKGRKKTPEAAKVIKGTFRKDRINSCRPDATPDCMVAPAWLPSGAIAHFDALRARVESLGLNSSSYTEVLALSALRLHEIEQLTKIIEAEGAFYTTESTVGGISKKSHPAVAQRSDASRHLQGLLAEFGLSPAAIQKVGAGQKKMENPFKAFG